MTLIGLQMTPLGPLVPRIHKQKSLPLGMLSDCPRGGQPEPLGVGSRRTIHKHTSLILSARGVVPARGHPAEELER